MVDCAHLFAGQGSQYVGMGKDLYEFFPESKQVFDKADRTLGFSLSKLMFEGPIDELTKTQNCQPAVLTASIAAFEAFRGATRPSLDSARDRQGRKATYAAGLSLGEYSALVAAEAISFEDAVHLVRRRGEFMEEEAQQRPGGMLSIIGLDLDKIKEICANTNTEVANINCPAQVVISGSMDNLGQAKKTAEGKGAKRAIFLEVSGAFHSSFMKEASEKLSAELDKIKVNDPRMPVVCNVTARPVTSSKEIKENLVKQLFSSVLWEDSMRFLLSKGIIEFFEFGPGRTLRGLMRRIDSNAQVVNIEKKEDIIEAASSEVKNETER